MNSLKSILNRFYREYDFTARLGHDPIAFPHRYRHPRDIEAAAFIASSLAYGKVELFKPVVEKVLSKMGSSPHGYLREFRIKRNAKDFAGIKYRFNDTEDLVALLFILHKIVKQNTSLEDAFMRFYGPNDVTIGAALSGFTASVLNVDTTCIYGKVIKPAGLRQFFPSPVNGSACKRANLFLRWMVRDRDIDFGIWKDIPKNRLIIPLDTHIAKIARCLGFTQRNSQDWKMAVEITEALKQIEPEDPLKYDFALCHHGISRICRGQGDSAACKACFFKGGQSACGKHHHANK